jgi:hypothetical protein
MGFRPHKRVSASAAEPETVPPPAVMWFMMDDADSLRVSLYRLTELVDLARQAPVEDRARVERTLQLVIQALWAVAWARQQLHDEACLREATEIAALCRRIEAAARMAGLNITGDDTSR